MLIGCELEESQGQSRGLPFPHQTLAPPEPLTLTWKQKTSSDCVLNNCTIDMDPCVLSSGRTPGLHSNPERQLMPHSEECTIRDQRH